MIQLWGLISLGFSAIYSLLVFSRYFTIIDKILTHMLRYSLFRKIITQMFHRGLLFFGVSMKTFKFNVYAIATISIISVILRLALFINPVFQITYIQTIYFCIFPILALNTLYRVSIAVYLAIIHNLSILVKLNEVVELLKKTEQRLLPSNLRESLHTPNSISENSTEESVSEEIIDSWELENQEKEKRYTGTMRIIGVATLFAILGAGSVLFGWLLGNSILNPRLEELKRENRYKEKIAEQEDARKQAEHDVLMANAKKSSTPPPAP